MPACTSVLAVSFFFFFFVLCAWKKNKKPAERCGSHQAPSCLRFHRRAERGWGGAAADTFCHGSGGCSQAALASKALTLGAHHASCLAHSNGIPGSVPSDCRLAPLPPSLAHTHKPAPVGCGSLIFIAAQMWDSEAFTYRLLTLHIRLHFFPPRCFATNLAVCFYCTSVLVSPPADSVCVFVRSWFLPFFVSVASVPCKEGYLALFPLFLTCKNTTELSLLTCVLHVDTTLAHPWRS